MNTSAKHFDLAVGP